MDDAMELRDELQDDDDLDQATEAPAQGAEEQTEQQYAAYDAEAGVGGEPGAAPPEGPEDELADELAEEAPARSYANAEFDELDDGAGPSHAADVFDELDDQVGPSSVGAQLEDDLPAARPADELEDDGDELGAPSAPVPAPEVDEDPDDLFGEDEPAAVAAEAAAIAADTVPHDELFDGEDDELAYSAPGAHAAPQAAPPAQAHAQAHAQVPLEDELLSDHAQSEAEEEVEPAPKPKKGGDNPQENLETVRTFLGQMENAVETDNEAYQQGRPGFMKVKMLNTLTSIIAMTKLHEILLQGGILGTLKAWLEPLANERGKTLPHPKVRLAVYTALAKLPLDTNHQEARDRIKVSGLGHVLSFYSRCSRETPQHRSLVDKLINRWTSPIVNEGRQDVADRDAASQLQRDQMKTLKLKRKAEREADRAEDDRNKRDQEGLAVGDAGYRYHARVPRPARLDYVVMPAVPQAIMQRMNEKPEKETGTRAELNKQFLKVTRNSKVSSQRSTKVDL